MSEKVIRCSACNVEINNWKTHIKTPVHIKNVERQRQEENVYFDKDCPLCSIPNREPLLFENQLVYLVSTREMKGHRVRVMAVIKRHSKNPTFEEKGFVYASVIDYMKNHTEKFFLAAPKEASVPDHWHLIACDGLFSDQDEKYKLFTNPHIELPIIKQRIMIGIPAYNESKTITEVIEKSQQFGDIIVVDDGSTDNTGQLARKFGATVISHNKNLGYGKSISTLFSYAKEKDYDILITLDADGQHNPFEIPEFLKEIKKSDVVVGNRFLAEEECNTPNYRKFGIKTISKLSGISDAQCGFRAYNKKAILTISDNLYEEGMGASVEILKILQKEKLKISETPCIIRYDKGSHSQNPFSHGFDVIRSILWSIIWENPAKTLFLPGLVMLIVSIIVGIQTINLYLQYHLVILSWALLTIGSMICGILILNIFIFVFVFKNKKEGNVK